ncbi:MAG: M50 family metallopeptidase [Candidatus Acidiferrales bacterium]
MMQNIRRGAIHLFRVAGIDLYLHWSWFLVAAYEIETRAGTYSSPVWNAVEYLALFLIVTLHEFGHALACRSVGGTANQIVLWPLGGVAYVDPPPRPGATLWSIAAGPLVNVALVPVFYALESLARTSVWADTMPNGYELLHAVWWINVGLLAFNILPIYPLDGGQILRSLLWFVLGRARSLMAAVGVGFVGAAGLVALAVRARSAWLGILCAFIVMNCWNGLKQARALLRREKLPRHSGFACPRCKAAPPVGNFWKCGQCGKAFDTFSTQAVCPYCAAHFATTICLDCGWFHPMSEWTKAAFEAQLQRV